MDVLKELNDVSAYIENHITDDIDITELAKITMQSSDGFSRLFSYMVGMTIHEYIRHRKLSLAAYDLQNTDDKIIDIAMKYGWNSSDAFTKAFVNQHGVTPSNARNRIGSVKIYPPVSFELNIKGAREMDFKIIDVEGFEVCGLSKQFGCQAGDRFKQENIMWSCGQLMLNIILKKFATVTMEYGTASGITAYMLLQGMRKTLNIIILKR